MSHHRINFTVLLTWAIVMIIGAALVTRLDVAEQPKPRQGKTLDISFEWPGASAKVIENNVTSRIEGSVMAVKGVENVSSTSYFGHGNIRVELKKNTKVSPAKFEITSLLRQIKKKLPQEVSYPELTGGEVVNDNDDKKKEERLLTYQANSNLSDNQLKEYIEDMVVPELEKIDEVRKIEVIGGAETYIEINYNPLLLASYGLSADDIESSIKSFIGREDIIGEVFHSEPRNNEVRMALNLTTSKFSRPLEQMPVDTVNGKIVYLNDLATYEYKNKQPESYYRVNGLNTVYLNIFADNEANRIKASSKIRKQISAIEPSLKKGVYLTLTHDDTEKEESELHKLIWRSLMSLLILLLLIWLAKRDLKYLAIMSITLAANILTAVIAYFLFDIRLHIYSLAGITVSLGLIIDASVVMVDHYSYYGNRKAFLAILAALLTTIGSLVIVFFLPEFLQKDLYDFAWIIIINLSAALLVAYFYAPALIDRLNYSSRRQSVVRHKRLLTGWKNSYARYISFTSRNKWIYIVLLVLAFGIPFHALPQKWNKKQNTYEVNTEEPQKWYADLYDTTFGSDFFQQKCKTTLAKIFGGTMRLFAESLSENTYRGKDEEMKLHIRAKMPVGGTAHDLNEKVKILENFLTQFDGIKRFETKVEGGGASVTVEFTDEARATSFPFVLENKVIGKIISIGGADWSTYGVSERGFSNSLNLQYRANRIEISGYNYDRLYRIAEDICDFMKRNSRIVDIAIETPGHENQEEEFYMKYDKEQVALYDVDIPAVHSKLKQILSSRDIGKYEDRHISADMTLTSGLRDKFDLWTLQNSYINVDGRDLRLSHFLDIERREAKNCIPKKKQEFVLAVAFNVLGSYSYTKRYVSEVIDVFNSRVPVGYKCKNHSYGWYEDNGTQYWLIALVVVIIFFICAILFESLRLPLVIVSLIPVSFIGTFLTYYFTGVEFGTGGFASLVLLSGLTVNGGIYIINEYLNIRKSTTGHLSPTAAYLRAYNHKIIAVLLTIATTVLGLVPFFIDGTDEPFWFSFAVGSTGGLLFSVFAIIFVMPIFMYLGKSGANKEMK